ncbi:MAG: hypothetical protein L3J66_12135 [Bacteroidales bacterium]|nr:hypothetical protein [Bacteroidales bacterium]
MKNYSFYKQRSKHLRKEFFRPLIFGFKNCEQHRLWIRNLYNEHFLKSDKMTEITEILKTSFTSCNDISHLLEHGYESLCYGGKCSLQNDSIIAASVIPRKTFIYYLNTKYKHFFKTKKDANNFISDLCLNTKTINPKYKSVLLRQKGRLVWMTWDKINNSSNPAYFLKTKYAEEARTALGLGFEDYRLKDMLVFIFTSSTSNLHRPTICDSGYNDFFRPTDVLFKQHGIIKPLNNGKYNILDNEYEITDYALRLPEAVNWGSDYSINDVKKCILLNSV